MKGPLYRPFFGCQREPFTAELETKKILATKALEAFKELHTLCQFDADSKPYLPMILAGQHNLLDLLQYRSSLPFASRIVARSHFEGIDLEQMQVYLTHHLALAGVKPQLFSAPAVTAIQQGSAGLLRKANHLARGAPIAAANEKCQQVSP